MFYQMALPFIILGQILHTDVVYLHTGQGFREAEKIKRLLLQYKYAKETSIYYSFLPNVMEIFTISILRFGWDKNSVDLTGLTRFFMNFKAFFSFSLIFLLLHCVYVRSI